MHTEGKSEEVSARDLSGNNQTEEEMIWLCRCCHSWRYVEPTGPCAFCGMDSWYQKPPMRR